MRLATKAFMTTVSGLVLVMSYQAVGTEGTTTAAATTSGTGDGTATGGSTAVPQATATSDDDSSSSSSDDAGTPSATSSAATSSAAKSSSSGTFTGDAVDTRWGVVQVEITVENGKITAAQAVQFPNDNPRDQEINAYAVPTLNSEVVAAQSGTIDSVSGATVTSGGYIQSLQSAIDQAHL